jgi:enoyl-CoA hydratase
LPPIAVRGTKKSLNALMKARANEAFELSMAYEFTSGGSEDILEAVKAFKEKRKPSITTAEAWRCSARRTPQSQ